MPPISTPVELAQAFAQAWTAAPRAPVADELAARLGEVVADARRSCDPVEIDARELITAIAARCPADDARAYIDRCHTAELALALAAARGDARAIGRVETEHRAALDGTCWRFAGAVHPIEDLRQMLREKLFVAPPGTRPKIAEYSGEGALASWLRVTAVRLFLDLRRRKDRAREAPVSNSLTGVLVDPTDLELTIVRVELRAAVITAINDAAQQLPAAARSILRLHLGQALSIDELASSLGIHRATAARRITRAREQLAATTRELLAERLRLPPDELDDIVQLVVNSRLDVSIGHLLRTAPPA